MNWSNLVINGFDTIPVELGMEHIMTQFMIKSNSQFGLSWEEPEEVALFSGIVGLISIIYVWLIVRLRSRCLCLAKLGFCKP